MSLENYLVKSDVSETEIRCSFRREEVSQLHTLLKEKGFDWYRDFLTTNLADILKYIALPPSRREAKKWTSRPDALLLRFAALQISCITLRFQSDIVDIEGIVNSGSYRSFHSVLVNALAPLLLDSPLKMFPFEGYDSPFS